MVLNTLIYIGNRIIGNSSNLQNAPFKNNQSLGPNHGGPSCDTKTSFSRYISEKLILTLLNKMKKGKASGTSGVVLEMLTSVDLGIDQMTNLFNQIIEENKVPEQWNTSVLVKCFKNKQDLT